MPFWGFKDGKNYWLHLLNKYKTLQIPFHVLSKRIKYWVAILKELG